MVASLVYLVVLAYCFRAAHLLHENPKELKPSWRPVFLQGQSAAEELPKSPSSADNIVDGRCVDPNDDKASGNIAPGSV